MRKRVLAMRWNERVGKGILEGAMPKKFVSDPGFELGTSAERRQIVEQATAEKARRPSTD